MSAEAEYDGDNATAQNDYVSRPGQKDTIPVQSDDAPVEDPIDGETADSDQQLGTFGNKYLFLKYRFSCGLKKIVLQSATMPMPLTRTTLSTTGLVVPRRRRVPTLSREMRKGFQARKMELLAERPSRLI